MNINRMMWGFVSLIVLLTIAFTFGTLDSRSQQKAQSITQQADMSKYAIADYERVESTLESEKAREERKIKSDRYNGQYWVIGKPHPQDGFVGRHDEVPVPSAIPAEESDLIVIGQVTTANAFLSTDKRSVYTEFTVCIDDLLGGNGSNNVVRGNCITADREGGYVRYPNGQKLLYRISGKDLPGVGGKYVLFLTNDNKTANYTILSGYELTDSAFKALDQDTDLRNLTGINKQDLVKMVRNKVSRLSNTPNEKTNKP